jgi:methionyl-tRNA formyltransferase
MTNTSTKILFFGTESYSLVALRTLVERGFDIAAVITKPDMHAGRGQKLVQPPVKRFALDHGIPVWQPTKLDDITPEIQALQPVIGVLVAYGKIIPKRTINLFNPGIINVHPSLLPRWRGPSPIEAAIAHMDDETGVSIMQLDAAMDAGPIYAQTRRTLDHTETKPQLYDELFTTGSQLLADILPDIISGVLQPTPQSKEGETYCKLLSKDDSLINPDRLTAAQANAHVRAHLGFPRSRIWTHDRDVIVTKTHVASFPQTPLDVQCQDNSWLVIDELIAPSGKTMPTEAYLRGYPL